jgi:hypothetical protein
VSDEREAMFLRVLALIEVLIGRMERLEETSAENAMAAAELAARQTIERDERRETDDLLAQSLGGKLVEIKPSSPFPMLVVDNDNPQQGGP